MRAGTGDPQPKYLEQLLNGVPYLHKSCLTELNPAPAPTPNPTPAPVTLNKWNSGESTG